MHGEIAPGGGDIFAVLFHQKSKALVDGAGGFKGGHQLDDIAANDAAKQHIQLSILDLDTAFLEADAKFLSL